MRSEVKSTTSAPLVFPKERDALVTLGNESVKMLRMLTGGCLCGAVRYEINGMVRHVTHCHCTMCRKAHGAAFATYAFLGRRRFRIAQGSDALRSYRSSADVTREFCGTCGSSLFWSTAREPDALSVTLGTLDGDPGGRPEAHIFARDKACWHEITDSLPQYAEDVPA